MAAVSDMAARRMAQIRTDLEKCVDGVGRMIDEECVRGLTPAAAELDFLRRGERVLDLLDRPSADSVRQEIRSEREALRALLDATLDREEPWAWMFADSGLMSRIRRTMDSLAACAEGGQDAQQAPRGGTEHGARSAALGRGRMAESWNEEDPWMARPTPIQDISAHTQGGMHDEDG